MGASAGRRSGQPVLPYCSSPEPPTPGTGSAGGAAGIVPESNDNNSNHNDGSSHELSAYYVPGNVHIP